MLSSDTLLHAGLFQLCSCMFVDASVFAAIAALMFRDSELCHCFDSILIILIETIHTVKCHLL